MPCVCSVRKDLANCHFSLVCLLSRFSVIKQRIHVGMNKSAEFSPTRSGFVCLDFVAYSFLGNRQLRKPQNKVLQQVAPYKKYFPQDICVTCCSEIPWILDIININIFVSNKTEMFPGEKYTVHQSHFWSHCAEAITIKTFRIASLKTLN